MCRSPRSTPAIHRPRPSCSCPATPAARRTSPHCWTPLAAAGYRVVALDLPGQFESRGLPTAGDHSPSRLGPLVAGLAATFDVPVRLLGHSYGGLVARAAVLAAPHRFTSLTLLSSGPAGIGGARRAAIEHLAPVLAAHGLGAVLDAQQAVALHDPAYVAPPPELDAFLRRRFLAGSAVMLQGMGDALRAEPDRVAELAEVGLPVLVVHGVDDDAWPPAQQRDMAVRLGAHHVEIPDAAHSAAVENPDALLAVLLDFWRSDAR